MVWPPTKFPIEHFGIPSTLLAWYTCFLVFHPIFYVGILSKLLSIPSNLLGIPSKPLGILSKLGIRPKVLGIPSKLHCTPP